ncbi:MAG: hypothetical protein ACLU9S_11785 [Oscillospiraceae bacterium]
MKSGATWLRRRPELPSAHVQPLQPEAEGHPSVGPAAYCQSSAARRRFAARCATSGGRESDARSCTLAQLRELETDMFTTVFVGNSQTRALAEAIW